MKVYKTIPGGIFFVTDTGVKRYSASGKTLVKTYFTTYMLSLFGAKLIFTNVRLK